MKLAVNLKKLPSAQEVIDAVKSLNLEKFNKENLQDIIRIWPASMQELTEAAKESPGEKWSKNEQYFLDL